MALGPYSAEPKPHIGSDFTFNHYENASSNYKKDAVDQVPLNLGINGIVPFLIRGSEQAYTVTRGSTTSN